MKFTHRLRTTLAASECRSLFEAAAALGVRVGWLDLGSAAAAPAELEPAAALGAFRSVGVTSDRVLTVKPVRGAAVVEDLIREHFAGCRLVVIRGELEVPELSADPDGYQVRFADGAEKKFSAEALAAALRKPRLRRLEASPKSAPSRAE